MPKEKPVDFDEEFEQAVVAWREQHRLREDDAVLLLVELFRIHQRHWDELRRREIPSFEQARADITKLIEAARTFQQYASTLIELLRVLPQTPRVTRATAISAALAGLLAGYLIGHAWL
ncbi:MAG: hypothetical protein WCS70_02460 [Verrucomicrobiota bacterium]